MDQCHSSPQNQQNRRGSRIISRVSSSSSWILGFHDFCFSIVLNVFLVPIDDRSFLFKWNDGLKRNEQMHLHIVVCLERNLNCFFDFFFSISWNWVSFNIC